MSLLSEAHYRDRHPEGYHVGYVSFDVSQLGRKKGRYTFTSRANVDEVINCTSALITRAVYINYYRRCYLPQIHRHTQPGGCS